MGDPNIPVLSQIQVLRSTRIRRERLLPRRGQVLATIGARVDPLDVVAHAPGEGHLRPVPITRYLHLSEEALDRYLLKRPGDPVAAREIIASKPELMGTLQRIYRAPADGRVAAVQGSWLAVELSGEPMELKALYRGSITNVMPRLGVVVEAVGTLVQGAWGGGGEGYGILKKMVDSAGDVLTEDKVDVAVRSAVVLAGAGITEQALRRAAQEHIAGVIIGGLEPRLKELIPILQVPVLITEGFGEHPMAQPIFELLASHHGQEASLNTASHQRGGPVRPEVFIPAMSSTGAPPDAAQLSTPAADVGSQVRISRAPYEGALGKIAAVPRRPQVLDSGVSAWGAEVELEGGERAFVPWPNLELIA